VGGKDQPFNNLVVFEASHPIPDEKGILATSRLIELISDSQPDDLIIFLVSGGGSALLVSPVRGISLGDIQELTSLLLSSGATIYDINALRKHLSKVKGGGLARFAAPAQVATLILSDVVGDPLDVIASGPTVPDSTTYEDAWEVLEKYDIVGITPSEITDHLKRGLSGELPETPKPGDPIFERVQNVVIGSNMLACQSAVRQATEEGFNSLILTTWLEGEASQAGGFLAAVLQQIASSGHPVPRPACIVVGGETTVTIQGGGLGGRNQEIALSAVSELESLQDVALITLATDGGDGPTDAAGAVATGNTLQRARSMGLDPEDYLNRNDSYHFFDQLDDLIRTGPTLTNVNDIAILIADHPERVVPS
jgi:hydroxypyruvate reductase